MNILSEIAAHKRAEIQHRKARISAAELHRSVLSGRVTLRISTALRERRRFGIIAEIKKSSPTAGVFKNPYTPSELASMYEQSGAAAISVLTDEKYFSGTLEDLSAVREHTTLPLLRKDFIIDEYQLLEARSRGADAVLLIAAILDRHQIRDLQQAATALGLETLVELYDTKEIDIIDFEVTSLIGINNRDLKTFSVDLKRSVLIASLLPRNVHIVSESGIRTGQDLVLLVQNGIRSALVGECLMRSDHPGQTLRRMLDEVDSVSQS